MTPAQGPRVTCALFRGGGRSHRSACGSPTRRQGHGRGEPCVPAGVAPPPGLIPGHTGEVPLSEEEPFCHLTSRSVSRAPEERGVPERPRGRQSRSQVVPAAPPPPVPPPVAEPGPDLPAPLTLALSKCYPKQTDGRERAVPKPRRAGAEARAGAGLGAVGAPLSPRDAAGAGERRARRFWCI